MKLIVCDIDGTLIDSPRQTLPSDRLIKAIQAIKQTHLVTCATGRVISWSRPFLEAAHFTAPCIVAGGTAIVDQNSFKILHENPLPADQFENIKQILRHYPNIRILFNDFTEAEFLAGGWELKQLFAADYCYVMEVNGLDHELAEKLIDKFNQLPEVTAVKISSPINGKINVQLLNQVSTKEHAINRLQEMTGVIREDTIGIGDGYNDFHIFNAVHTKIAVGNAIDELKVAADNIIGSVADDGVAQYLESLADL